MRTHVLVAGADYEFKGVDFRIFCNNRIKRLVAANAKKEDLTFQVFDIRKAEVFTHEVTYVAGKKTEKLTPLSPSPFTAVTKAHFNKTVGSDGENHYRLKDGQSGLMSILDIYKAVQKIGTDAPGTLVELSFFSHSWMGGPILLNSSDDGNVMIDIGSGPMPFALPSAARDPDDFDPRSKDFAPPVMGAAELKSFQDAFETNAFVWQWGCAFPRLVHEILHKVERHRQYKDSGLGDDVEFEFTNFRAGHIDLLENFLSSALGGPFPDRTKIKLKFKFIKHFFCLITVASYAHSIAVNAKRKTFAGVMGTYSIYDIGKLGLMTVEPSFGRHFTFYKNYLGFKFDPEGRHYGEYDPAFTCTTPSP